MPDVTDSIAERLFRDAGITAGMRVLDVGCGMGNVSVLLANLVGAGGQVVGIDRDAQALEMAREQMRQLSLPNVTFTQCDVAALPPDLGSFDAAVGRRVLMYVPDPVNALRRIAGTLKPGGIVAFVEHDATMTPGHTTPMPLHDQVLAWTWQTVQREGGNIHIGFDLPHIFAEAGLPLAHLRAEAVIQTPDMPYRGAAIIRAMLPRILAHGVATEQEIDIDTLEQRMEAERTKANATFISDMVFGAWARKPQ